MQNIVAFRPAKKDPSAAAPARTEAAQILFFTGIRYVRVIALDEADVAADGPAAAPVDAVAHDDADRLLA